MTKENPIPITQQWLIENATPESSLNCSFHIEGYRIFIDLVKGGNDLDCYFALTKNEHVRVKYVHQLLNLIAALKDTYK